MMPISMAICALGPLDEFSETTIFEKFADKAFYLPARAIIKSLVHPSFFNKKQHILCIAFLFSLSKIRGENRLFSLAKKNFAS